MLLKRSGNPPFQIGITTATILLLLMSANAAYAQHEHMDTTTQARQAMPGMSMLGPLGISMERMGSGTTWIPDALILPSRHFMAGPWMIMLHGFLFGQYDWQGGPRGDSQWGSLNWAMIMADREVGGGRLQLRFMPSLDPWTVGTCGYPLLLQSGETCNGEPLTDRQHPHDFFMELGALYERELTSNTALLLYAAPAGEPALGPVAFMHRPSAMDEPQAPLGHHWQDATHISFGVATIGLFTRTIRLEASAFNGTEPNEARWDFDKIALNSYSGRVTVNPNQNWSFTTGYGWMENPERADPAESMTRFVASAMYGREVGLSGQWGSTLIYGNNKHGGEGSTHSILAESEAILDQHNTLLGRFEYVQKSAHDLDLPAFPDERTFNVFAGSLGYIRELARGRGITIGIGARGTVNVVPGELEPSYGSRTPGGGMVFLRLRPYHTQGQGGMQMDHRQGWLSNLHLGARDPATGGFVMLGKTFKGLTDELLEWQTRELLARETHRETHVVYVRPELVVEIAFNEVQRSSQYSGGVALRFARVKGYRPDKHADEADTIDVVRSFLP